MQGVLCLCRCLLGASRSQVSLLRRPDSQGEHALLRSSPENQSGLRLSVLPRGPHHCPHGNQGWVLVLCTLALLHRASFLFSSVFFPLQFSKKEEEKRWGLGVGGGVGGDSVRICGNNKWLGPVMSARLFILPSVRSYYNLQCYKRYRQQLLLL